MGAKILVADDSITIQKVIGLSFANEDFVLESADNGDEALEKALANPPDLIIADTNMPGLSGYELCERVRGSAKLAGIPLILLTGTYEVFDEDRAKKVGSSDHLTKPFESQVLIKKVKHLLANPPAKPAAPATAAAATPPPVAAVTPPPAAPAPKPAQPEAALEEFETIDSIEEFEAESVETGAADFGGLDDDFSDAASVKPMTAKPAPAAPVASKTSETAPFGFGDAPAKPSPAQPAKEDVNFSALAAATSTKTDEYVSDWNMDEFENYLAQDSQKAAPAPTAAPAATPTIASESFETFEVIETFETLDVEPEPAAAPAPSQPADVFSEFEQTYNAEPELDSVAAHVETQPQANKGIELEPEPHAEEMELELSTDLASEAAAISPRGESRRPIGDSLEATAAAQFEQTFDGDVSSFHKPQAAAAASVDPAELEAQIQAQVQRQLQQAMDSTAQKQIAGAVESAVAAAVAPAVSQAVAPAVEKAVAAAVDKAVAAAVDKAVKQVLDEIRRRLS